MRLRKRSRLVTSTTDRWRTRGKKKLGLGEQQQGSEQALRPLWAKAVQSGGAGRRCGLSLVQYLPMAVASARSEREWLGVGAITGGSAASLQHLSVALERLQRLVSALWLPVVSVGQCRCRCSGPRHKPPLVGSQGVFHRAVAWALPAARVQICSIDEK